MKYIFLSCFIFTLTSCSFSPTPQKDIPENIIPNNTTGWVQVTNSGVSILGESGSIVIDSTGAILIKDNTEKVSVSASGINITGTGMNQIQDAELQNIEQDINALFSEIEKWGK